METSADPLPRPTTERSLLATAFTTKGRANRLRYLIYLMSYCPLIMILGLLGSFYVIGIPIVIANYICATIQRCHDIGLNGWWSAVLGLPGPNLALLAIRGKTANRYGDPPAPVGSERLIASLMVVLTLVACSAYYLYIFRPAIQAYETRNAIGGGSWRMLTGASPIDQLNFVSPTGGSIILDTGQRVSMTYRARYRNVYVSFTLDGNQYLEQLQHNTQTDRLEVIDGGAIIATYGR